VIIIPENCANGACNIPGWDWLWLLLGTGGFFLFAFLVCCLLAWWEVI
jgi:hypothetical protein